MCQSNASICWHISRAMQSSLENKYLRQCRVLDILPEAAQAGRLDACSITMLHDCFAKLLNKIHQQVRLRILASEQHALLYRGYQTKLRSLPNKK